MKNLTACLPAELMMNKGEGVTVGALLDGLPLHLEKISETPGLDARALLVHILDSSSSWVMAHPEVSLTSEQAEALETMVARLEKGDPLPYVLGHWDFFGKEFEVTPDVLIPRPETELLVERAISWLQMHPGKRNAVDVGTGSGCIGITLAATVPDLRVLATDISSVALKIALRNALKNGVGQRVEFLCCDLLPSNDEFDLIVANPPYIPTNALRLLPIFGREPTLALDGGIDGLGFIRRLVTAAPERLVPGGLLIMEIEATEGPEALSMAFDAFSKAEIHLHKDLAGRDRILEVQS